MPAKRAAGILRELIVRDDPARAEPYRGGRSLIIKILTPNGQHIGTVHEIVMPGGGIPHSHPKDYTRRSCERIGPLRDR